MFTKSRSWNCHPIDFAGKQSERATFPEDQGEVEAVDEEVDELWDKERLFEVFKAHKVGVEIEKSLETLPKGNARENQ